MVCKLSGVRMRPYSQAWGLSLVTQRAMLKKTRSCKQARSNFGQNAWQGSSSNNSGSWCNAPKTLPCRTLKFRPKRSEKSRAWGQAWKANKTRDENPGNSVMFVCVVSIPELLQLQPDAESLLPQEARKHKKIKKDTLKINQSPEESLYFWPWNSFT